MAEVTPRTPEYHRHAHVRRNMEHSSFGNFAQRMEDQRAQKMEKKFEERGLRYREEFIDAAERAAAKNPHISKNTFTSVLNAYDAEFASLRKGVAEIRATATSRLSANVQVGNLQQTFITRVRERLAPHGPAAEQAMRAISKEQQPPSFFTPVVKMIYNSDKGGLQAGGAVGAIAAAGLGYYVAGASGMSGLVKIGITAAVGIAGAFIGNKLLPQEQSYKPTDLRSAMKTPTLGKSKAIESAPTTTPVLAQTTTPNPDMKAALKDAVVKSDSIKPAPLTGSETNAFSPDTTAPSANKTGAEIV